VIVGLWLIADLIERQTGVSKISELGGVAKKAPILAIFMVIIAFANIALPLTNAFVGEFMLFNGLFQMKPWIISRNSLPPPSSRRGSSSRAALQ
jgi:NADH-quinone oxidoreductase subunit M